MKVTQEPTIDNKRWAGFVVAVLMARTTGDNLSGLMYDVFPYEFANMIGPLIGYGFTGVLLGLCMFYCLGGVQDLDLSHCFAITGVGALANVPKLSVYGCSTAVCMLVKMFKK